MPFVATVLTTTQFTTLRARDRGACGLGHKRQAAVPLDDDQDDAPALRVCPNRRGHVTLLDGHASAIRPRPEEA
jgi:hypothetical protein